MKLSQHLISTVFLNQEVVMSETLEEYGPLAEDLTLALLQNLGIVCLSVSHQLLHNTLYVYGLVCHDHNTLHYRYYVNDYPTSSAQLIDITINA